MKRSEMVNFLAANLYTGEPVEINKPDWNQLEPAEREDYESRADLLLALLEKAGMIPPTRTEKSAIPGFADFQVNKWEPENEQTDS